MDNPGIKDVGMLVLVILCVCMCVCLRERQVLFSGPFSSLSLVLQSPIKEDSLLLSDSTGPERHSTSDLTNDTQVFSGEQTHQQTPQQHVFEVNEEQ